MVPAGISAEQEGLAKEAAPAQETSRIECNASFTELEGRTARTDETGGNLEEVEATTSLVEPEGIAAKAVTG